MPVRTIPAPSRVPYAAAMLVLVVVLLTAACSSSPPAAPSPAGGPTIAGTDLPASPTALPTYTLQRFQAVLAGLKGRPVVVNYWASWCGPCIQEAPVLSSLAKRYAGTVQFVGVDIQDTTDPARDFIQKYGWTYPSVADPTGSIRNGMGFVGQPVTVLYDSNGAQVQVWAGASLDSLDDALSKVA